MDGRLNVSHSLFTFVLSPCSWLSNQRHGGSRLEAEVAELEESLTRSGQSLKSPPTFLEKTVLLFMEKL